MYSNASETSMFPNLASPIKPRLNSGGIHTKSHLGAVAVHVVASLLLTLLSGLAFAANEATAAIPPSGNETQDENVSTSVSRKQEILQSIAVIRGDSPPGIDVLQEFDFLRNKVSAAPAMEQVECKRIIAHTFFAILKDFDQAKAMKVVTAGRDLQESKMALEVEQYKGALVGGLGSYVQTDDPIRKEAASLITRIAETDPDMHIRTGARIALLSMGFEANAIRLALEEVRKCPVVHRFHELPGTEMFLAKDKVALDGAKQELRAILAGDYCVSAKKSAARILLRQWQFERKSPSKFLAGIKDRKEKLAVIELMSILDYGYADKAIREELSQVTDPAYRAEIESILKKPRTK